MIDTGQDFGIQAGKRKVVDDLIKERDDWKQRALDAELKIELALSREQTMKQRAEAAEKAQTAIDKNVQAVCSAMRKRAEKGLAKYGVTTERTDLTQLQWMQHLQEELMDATVYVERLKQEFSSTAGTGYLSPAEVKEKVKPLVEFLKSTYDSWDCDMGNVNHHSMCRSCEAEKLLTNARKDGLL